jgi:hypothetical protein
MYDGRLLAHCSASERSLATLPHLRNRYPVSSTTNGDLESSRDEKAVLVDDHLILPMLFVDTAGCDAEEVQEEEGVNTLRGSSRQNPGEAALVVAHVKVLPNLCSNINLWHYQRLLSIGLHEKEIGVITPYNGQVCLGSLILLLIPSFVGWVIEKSLVAQLP